jgi:starvation-inducible outer membrane lipoprotein
MSAVNITSIVAIAALALAGCVSDPNNLNKRVGLNTTSQPSYQS